MTRKSAMKTWITRVTLAAVVLAAGVIGVTHFWRRATEQAPLPDGASTYAVRRSPLHYSLRAAGRVESARRTLIECELENVAYSNEGRTASAGGSRILELIPEGTSVHQNDVLCRLDASDYEELVRLQEIKLQQSINDYEKAELDVKAARISLAEYRDGTLPQTLQAIDGEILMAQSDIKRQSDRVTWAEQMLKNGYYAQGQFGAEKDRMLRSQVALQLALGQRQVIKRFRAPIAIQRLETIVAQTESMLTFQDLRCRRNKSLLEKFRTQVEYCTIRAPHDGFVIYANEGGGAPRVEVGVRVFQKMDLFFLPDLSEMEVETVLNESIVDRVRKQQQTRVRVESLPDSSIEGHVVDIAPLPFVRRDIPGGSDVRSYLGRVRLHSSPRGLLPGMTAEVEIATGQRDTALVVPTESVVADHGHDYCYVSGRDGLERREIQIGEGTRDLIEVKSGLGEGEEVVLDPSKLDDEDVELAASNGKHRESLHGPGDAK